MLNFLNILFLFALAAMAIPLIIHLLNKQRIKKISFSSLRFLKVMEKQRLKKIKLLQWLLLIIRTLIITFLVFTFARPVLMRDYSIPLSNTEKTVIIILDDGLNMFTYDQDGMHFQRAKRKLYDVLSLFDQRDEIHILSAVTGENIEIAQVANLSCRYQSQDWSTVFNQCLDIYSNTSNLNKQLFIISDYLFNSEIQNTLSARFNDLPIYYCVIGKGNVYNFSVDSVEINSQLLEIGKPVLFKIALSNNTSDQDGEIEVHLYLNETRMAHQQVAIKSRKTEFVEMSYSPKVEKIYQGYVEINDDDLLVDNRHYFSFEIQSEIQLLCLEKSSSPYLRAALESIAEKSNISVTYEQFATWRRQNFNRFHLLLLNNPGPLENNLLKKISEFADMRGSIIIMPGNNTKPDQFNRAFKDMFGGLKLGKRKETSSNTRYFNLKPLQLDQPLFDGLYRTTNLVHSLPRFYKYFQVLNSRPVEKPIVFTNEDPFLVKSNDNYLFTAYIDEAWTDMQYKGLFTPLLARLFQVASLKASPIHKKTSPGIPVTIRLQEGILQNKYSLHYPDGNVQNLLPLNQSHINLLSLSMLNEPGNYPIYNGQMMETIINVNIDRKSLIPPYPDLKDDILHRIFDEEVNIKQESITADFGNELSIYTLILVLLLIAAEHIIVKFIEGDNAA